MRVRLVKGGGSPGRGGGLGGSYWHIVADQKRVGYVFINIVDEPPLGRHVSIQIHVNQPQRGKGIGSQAYRQACEQSGHPVVYAHMRKSNLASRRSAENADFKIVSETPQLTMRWCKS